MTNPSFKDWLICGAREDKMNCKFCNCAITARLSALKTHMETKKHIEAQESLFLNKTITFPKENKTDTNAIKRKEIRAALFTAFHTSMNVVNHYTHCYNKMNLMSKSELQLSRTKCTGIIVNVIAPFFREALRTDIADSSFSLLIDESTDISVSKYLGVVIRYFSSEKKRSNLCF